MIKLLGVPYDGNASFLKGPALAPPRIRLMDQEGSANQFCEQGKCIQNQSTYIDLGDMTFSSVKPEQVYHEIKQRVADEISNHEKMICLGGDHSISYPIIEAYSNVYEDLHILHFDAHADLYDNFENNPYSHASPFARIMEMSQVKLLTQVGIRTLNTHQREQAKRFDVNVIEMKDFNIDFINNLKAPLYISLDLDVLDPAFAPGISHHEPGGMTTRELISAIQSISVEIVGADIVEYNPTRDVNNMTAMVAYKLFKELASKMI